MHSVGVLPEDTPDPRLDKIEFLRQHMPVPLLGLVPQPHLEDWDCFGAHYSTRMDVVERMTVGITYTLWRNPDDRDDPVNLAELDDATRQTIEAQTPWPRPRWLIDLIERKRYPTLHEAVRTSWARDGVARQDVGAELVAHVNHLLRNRFHERRPPGTPAGEGANGLVDERCVERGAPVVIDGAEVHGIRIDTDPYVFGLGADLGSQGILTAVIDRIALPYVTLAFAPRPLTG